MNIKIINLACWPCARVDAAINAAGDTYIRAKPAGKNIRSSRMNE